MSGSHMFPEPHRARRVPFCVPLIEPEYASAVADQVLSGWLGPGPATVKFAELLSALAGVEHCVLTTSGTVALQVAAGALDLRPGDEVLLPAYGVISTINAFAYLGLRPKLVDIDLATGCMSAAALEGQASSASRAVCYVNFSGYVGPNTDDVIGIATRLGLPVVEDAACALGQVFDGRGAGSRGIVGTYSFSVPKVLTTGQGGAVVTNSEEAFDRASRIIDQGDPGWRRSNLTTGIGSNLRFNDVLAALGLAQLRRLDERVARKRQVFEALAGRLPPWLFRLAGDAVPLHNVVFASDRDLLISELSNRGVDAVGQYRVLSEHPPYAGLAGDFPAAEFWSRHAVYLPFGMAMTAEDAEQVAWAVLDSDVELLELG